MSYALIFPNSGLYSEVWASHDMEPISRS